jgi:hypothetical protein
MQKESTLHLVLRLRGGMLYADAGVPGVEAETEGESGGQDSCVGDPEERIKSRVLESIVEVTELPEAMRPRNQAAEAQTEAKQVASLAILAGIDRRLRPHSRSKLWHDDVELAGGSAANVKAGHNASGCSSEDWRADVQRSAWIDESSSYWFAGDRVKNPSKSYLAAQAASARAAQERIAAVSVKTLTGKTITLEAEASDTIDPGYVSWSPPPPPPQQQQQPAASSSASPQELADLQMQLNAMHHKLDKVEKETEEMQMTWRAQGTKIREQEGKMAVLEANNQEKMRQLEASLSSLTQQHEESKKAHAKVVEHILSMLISQNARLMPQRPHPQQNVVASSPRLGRGPRSPGGRSSSPTPQPAEPSTPNN